MLKQQSDVLYQCRMLAKGTAVAAVILCGVYLLLIVILLTLPELEPMFAFAVSSPGIAFVLVVGITLVRQAETVFTITADMVVLSRFCHVITQFPRGEITSAGVFVRYNNKGYYLYITTEKFEDLSASENPAETNAQQFRILKTTANKKGSKSICIEETKKRTDAIQKLIPEFDPKNVIRL